MAHVQVNTDECVGSAHCVYTAPDLFALDEEGLAGTLRPELSADRRDAAEAAVRGCPASAISIVEE